MKIELGKEYKSADGKSTFVFRSLSDEEFAQWEKEKAKDKAIFGIATLITLGLIYLIWSL